MEVSAEAIIKQYDWVGAGVNWIYTWVHMHAHMRKQALCIITHRNLLEWSNQAFTRPHN